MKNFRFTWLVFLSSCSIFASDITIENVNSEHFPLGKESKVNMKIVANDNSEMWLQIGIRVQGTFEMNNDAFDAYLRRVRLEAAVGFDKHTSFIMDIRNDKANYQDKGEETFNVGDAYLKVKKPFDNSLLNFKFYRGKIDVSRTETVKSAYVIHYDRPYIADEAAQFISHNRRGTNIQAYGDLNKKIHYQIAIGDGIYSGKLKDSSGSTFSGSSFEQKSFFYGGKVSISPFDGWEETKKTETYFGKGKHLSIGASYWVSPNLSYNDNTISQTIDHTLINLEASLHYEGFFIQTEYFLFGGVVKDWGVSEVGSSKGWYVTSEYVFKEFNFIAPFVRYESWNKFNDTDGYDFSSKLAGINWYLRGNTSKFGIVYEQDIYGISVGNKTNNIYKLTSQWFF